MVFEGTVILKVRFHADDVMSAQDQIRYIAGDIQNEYNRNVEWEGEDWIPRPGFVGIIYSDITGGGAIPFEEVG